MGAPGGGADHGRRRRARRPREVVGQLEQEADAGDLEGGEALSARLRRAAGRASRAPGDDRIDLRHDPTVIMVVGVNGTGKTTTIGKLAWHLQRELGQTVVLGAADTFRAAAVEQLAGLGRARGLRHRHRAARAPTRARSRSTRSPRAASAAPTSSSSTPPGACTRRTT